MVSPSSRCLARVTSFQVRRSWVWKVPGSMMSAAPRKPSWKTLAQVSPRERRESWEQFLSRAYWEVELEP